MKRVAETQCAMSYCLGAVTSIGSPIQRQADDRPATYGPPSYARMTTAGSRCRTEEERVRKAMQMLDMAEEMVNRGPVIDLEPRRIEYDPTDGDELAEQERRRQEQQQQDDNNQPGGIGR